MRKIQFHQLNEDLNVRCKIEVTQKVQGQNKETCFSQTLRIKSLKNYKSQFSTSCKARYPRVHCQGHVQSEDRVQQSLRYVFSHLVGVSEVLPNQQRRVYKPHHIMRAVRTMYTTEVLYKCKIRIKINSTRI